MFTRNAASSSLLAVAALILGACQSLPVTTDYNPSESMAICRTYTWAHEHVGGNSSGQPAAFANPLNADRLRAAIEANLSARGLARAADPKSADCVVGFAIGSRVVFDDFGPYGGGWGGYWGPRGWGGWGYGGFYDYPWVHEEGRIAVDVFDARTRQAIWHASVVQNVVRLTGPHAEAKINEAAAAIFTKFPGTAPGSPVAPNTAPRASS
jgi:hypothetical protein